ncbi:MAG: hypothetical protein HDT22_01925 [Ruminococcus sp.]|nr:hypothetical protein [Ruminococcus sp.]
MKQFFKNHICFIKKIVILIPVSICLTFLIGIYLLCFTNFSVYLIDHFAIREKHHFTNRETSLISDVIHIRCNKIEKMIGFYGKDCSFAICISDFEKEDLNINYTKTVNFYDEVLYEENNTDKIFPIKCNFEKYEEQDVLVVEIYDYDPTLYNIVPQPSLLTCLLVFLIISIALTFLIYFIFSRIKNLIIRIKNKKNF